MMAEIFMLRLEAAARAAKEAAATSSRFVPIKLPACEGVLAHKVFAALATAPRKKPRTSRTGAHSRRKFALNTKE